MTLATKLRQEGVSSVSQARMADRLRRGQRWLAIEWRKFREMDPGSLADAIETRFSRGIDKWDRLEHELRDTKYEGCPIGKDGCVDDAPVWCAACEKGRPWERRQAEGQGSMFATGVH